MSTTIDERVVEMRFDNQQFERNVSTTMSTLDKLKQKLHLTGASKGLEEVNHAAKKVDMSGLGSGIEAVSAKFSAMQVVGVTALANITNSAINAGKRMISALTIDPVKTGFQEYETQINATQTILANTASKGSTIDDVNKALEELNKYADLTIYNFTEMTRNIGTFTAAGIDLDTSVNAIQGIANLAAVSGSTSQQASTAMYQLSQALAAGTVKLMDWNSVVNAGMGGEMFQNALKETSELLGTGAEAAIKAEGSFRESLRSGWLTSEVLTETLKKFTTTGANEYVADYIGQSPEVVESALKEAKAMYGEADAIEYASKALAEKYGKNQDEIKQALQFAKNAEDAATKVKTFSQLWDVMKESAQSGWSQTWKLIVGDFEEAKNLLTPLADFATGIIGKFSDARNAVLESALGKSFTGLVDNIKGFMKPIQESADAVKDVVKSVEDYANIVDDIIGGKWGNGQERWDKLAESGYDWAHAQNLVNEKLGSSVRHATDYKEAQDSVTESQEKTTESTTELIAELAELAKTDPDKLKEMGYTEEQIQSFRELADAAEKTGIPLKDFIKNIDQINGRYLLIGSFKNIGEGLLETFKAIGEAWKGIFPPKSTEEKAQALFNIIAALHKFSMGISTAIYNNGEFTETGDNLIRTLKGLFAIVDLVTTIIGGGFKIGFKVISSILSYFNLDILDVTANIGDVIVKFRDWIDSLLDVSDAMDVIVPALKTGIGHVKSWLKGFSNLTGVNKFIDALESLFKTIKSFDFSKAGSFERIVDSLQSAVARLKKIDLKEIGTYILEGLVNGLGNGINNVAQKIMEIGTTIIDAICKILGINSPSKVFMAIGGFVIAGLVLGLKDGLISVPETLQGIVDKCLYVIQSIDWGAVFAIGVSLFALAFIKKVGDALEAFSAPFEGLGDIFEETAGVIKNFGKVTKAVATNIKTKSLKNLAVALAILAGTIIALTFFNPRELLTSVGIIAILAGVLVGLAWATSKMSDASVKIGKDGANIEGLKSSLLPIAAAILILGATVKLIGSMHPEEAIQGFLGMAGIMTAMLVFVWACKKITDGNISEHTDKIGKLMLKLSIALLLMVGVVKLVGKLSTSEILKGVAFMAGFAIFIRSLSAVTKGSKDVNKLGGTILKVTLAMALMVGVLKLIDMLSVSEMIKGAGFAAAFVLFVKGLTKAATVGKDGQIAKLGGLLLSVSISMGLMVGVCKLIDHLKAEEMIKGVAFAAAFVLFVKALVKVTSIGSDTQMAKVTGTILGMSVAIGILAGVAIMLSLLNVAGLVKGILAVSALAAMMSLMIHATKGANDVKGNLIAMSVAIALMAAAVAGLSFIKPEKLAGATAAMSILMGMFSLMIKSSENAKGAMGTLIVMTVAIAALAGVLWLMSTLDVQSSISNATALSILLVAVSGAMLILSKMNTNVKNALKGIIALTAMSIPMLAFVGVLKLMSGLEVATGNVIALTALMTVSTILLSVLSAIGTISAPGAFIGVLALTSMAIPLLAFVGVLSLANNVQNATTNAELLTKMATTLTLLLIPLTIVGYLWIGAAAGIVALTAMAIPMLAFVGVLALMNNIQNATENADLLISLVTTMTGVLTQLALIGPLALIGVGAMQGLVLVMAEVGILATAVGALVEKFPSIQTFIDTGLPLLEQLSRGIGTIIGSFASGLLEGLTSGLPQVGTDLSMFMTNAIPFIVGAKMIDATVMEGVKTLAEAILILTAADILTGITSWISGGSSLSSFGAELASLGTNLNTFVTNLGTFDESKVMTVRCAANAIKAMAEAASNIDGQAEWAKKLFGDNSIATFSSQLPGLGTNLNQFISNLGTFDESKTETVKCAVNAIAEMAKVANEIPNEGGWAAKIFGDNGLGTFSSQLPTVGTSLNSFATNLGTFDESKVETVKCAAKAIKEMATAATSIDGQAGWAAKLFGDNSIAAFSSQLPTVGTSLSGFATNLGTFNEDTVATVRCAANAIKEMAIAGSSIDGQAEWAKKIFGDNSIAAFSSQFGTLGTNLSTFATNLGTFDESKVTTVRYAVKAISAFADLANTDLSGAKKNISGFGDKLSGFATDIATFCDDMPSGESVDSAISSMNKIIKLIKSIASVDASSVESFTKSLNKVGKEGVDKFVKAFTNGTAKTDVKKAAKDLVDQAIKGVEAKEKALKTAFTNAARDAADALDDKYNDFYDAGSYLVDGFTAGISENDYKAEAKASAMAEAAAEAARKALKINSPSKVFRSIGYSIPEGFAMGIDKLSGLASESVGYMADTAIETVSNSISRIASAVNSDIDAQPTIRPVLDLSDVRAGASSIGSMLGFGTSVGVMANVGAISSMMNSNQNGTNGDVVSAIDKLRKDMSNLGGTTYQINGINYNDDAVVSDAIQTLMRHARIERRI